ncbi:MAG: efflux RND transporter periplasmic adaptor subunit [Bacteroidales bacterium]
MRYLFLSAGIAMMMISCNTAKQNKEDAVLLTAITAKGITPNNKSEFSFISKPYSAADLSFRVGGPLAPIELLSGKHYGKGETITTIDPRDFIIRKEKAEAVYKQAQSEFERIEALYKLNNISASAYDKARADYVNAKTAFQTASNELEDTKLIAPFSGYVGEVYVEKYQDVRPVQKVLSFVDLDRLKIEAYIPQSVAVKAQKIKEVAIEFDLIPDKIFTASVLEVSKSTMSNNISYLLTAEFKNPDKEGILAGMSGKVDLNLLQNCVTDGENNGGQQAMIAVPQTAVSHRPGVGDYVWVIDTQSSTVSQRTVTPGDLLDGGLIQIAQGLDEGEMVATSSLRFLSQGSKVKIQRGGNHKEQVK